MKAPVLELKSNVSWEFRTLIKNELEEFRTLNSEKRALWV